MTSIDGATAHSAGLGAGARLPSSVPSLHSAQHRAVPARTLYHAVLPHTGGAPVVPLAHARAALAVTREARVTSIDGVTAHPAGLGAGARLPSSVPSLHSAQRRAVPARTLYHAVLPHTGGTPAVLPAHARVAAQGTRDGRALARARAVAWTTGLGTTARLPS